jgi:hypothetical protein
MSTRTFFEGISLWIISRHSLCSSDEFVPCVGKYALMMHIFTLVAMVIAIIRSLPSSSCLTLLLQSDGHDIGTSACPLARLNPESGSYYVKCRGSEV